MYVSFAFMSILIGYSIGCAPLMGFQYGAKNRREMQSLFRKSIAVISVMSVLMFVSTRFAARPLAEAFVGSHPDLVELTCHAFLIQTTAFLPMGLCIYGSSLFTSLGNGVVSAVISFLRTLVFETGSVMVLPLFLGPDGIWYALLVAEIVSLVITVTLAIRLEPRYGYITGEVR